MLAAYADWSHSTDCLQSQIAMTQRRAARFVTSSYQVRASVTKMQLNWESLETQRQSSTMSLCTKGVQGEVDTDAISRLKSMSSQKAIPSSIQRHSGLEPAQLTCDTLAKSAHDDPSYRTSYSHQHTGTTDWSFAAYTNRTWNGAIDSLKMSEILEWGRFLLNQ